MGRKRRLAKGWCAWGDKPCVPSCPTDAIDNHGQPYKACPAFRLKTQAEIDEMCRPAPAPPVEQPKGDA